MLEDISPVFVISVAAQLSGLHPQTLRTYDKLGLVSPDRAPGRGRRYSSRDISQLREVQRLSQEHGVNLAGIKRILELENQVTALQQRLAISVTVDPSLADEVERLARMIAGEGANSSRLERARRVAEAHASHWRDLVPLRQATVAVVWPSQPFGVRPDVPQFGE